MAEITAIRRNLRLVQAEHRGDIAKIRGKGGTGQPPCNITGGQRAVGQGGLRCDLSVRKTAMDWIFYQMVNFVVQSLCRPESQLVLPTPAWLKYKRTSLRSGATGHKTGSQDRIEDENDQTSP